MKPTYNELVEMIAELEGCLDYCGWGDSWERECSEDTRKRLEKLNARLNDEQN